MLNLPLRHVGHNGILAGPARSAKSYLALSKDVCKHGKLGAAKPAFQSERGESAQRSIFGEICTLIAAAYSLVIFLDGTPPVQAVVARTLA